MLMTITHAACCLNQPPGQEMAIVSYLCLPMFKVLQIEHFRCLTDVDEALRMMQIMFAGNVRIPQFVSLHRT